jgi:hypothetical protein
MRSLRIQVKTQGDSRKLKIDIFLNLRTFLNDFFRATSFCQTPYIFCAKLAWWAGESMVLDILRSPTPAPGFYFSTNSIWLLRAFLGCAKR